MAEQFYMTQAGYEEKVKLHDYLVKVKRAEIIERIAEARSHGDLSENAEYDAARREQESNEFEISTLESQIKNAVIIEENEDTSSVHIGSRVTVYDEELEEETEYTIMGTTEANPLKNIISNESPVGMALLRHKRGDTVIIKAPDGEYPLKILKIE